MYSMCRMFTLLANCPVLSCHSDFLPAHDYFALARKSSQWSSTDQTRWENVGAVVQRMPVRFSQTCFRFSFPSYVGVVSDPDGFNFHKRMQNCNGKWILEYLIKVSLGTCKPLNTVYQDILVCQDPSQEQCYFRIDHSTHSRGQPHSDPTNYYTGDVVAMAFKSSVQWKAVEWMRADSPRTPKCTIGDAERSCLAGAIADKMTKMRGHIMCAEVFGLVVGGI